ncbi:zinc-binding dehydrogenase [Roseomonas sp. NAR14]|uniref:Zinc-binding dehydrogenase n=1 Tax=Roseomonas acroporae TaxID=2937791 RepID=A0A9X1Y3Q9_9PROT|nr:zinc-binding dehydrogenase [Roseomonas acroporae]MCK8783604.1 zinc-binding dehydrogenase [Roseomonas acroporae]
MKGVVFLGDREVALMDFPDPTPGPGEVVLEMKASGMCGSDLKQYRRAKGAASVPGLPPPTEPVIGGHEPCGVVVAVGPGVFAAEAVEGNRVMCHHYHGCDNCGHCRTGWAQLCQTTPIKVYGNNAHGGHARYLKVPAHTLVELPEAMSFAAGAAVSCGTGTAYGALRRLDLSGRDTIAIFGQGPVGLSATQLAKAMGARVIALDVSPERLERARAFGADWVVNPAQDDAAAAIRELTGGGADCTLDTSSSPAARVAALRALKVWGRACYVGEGNNVEIDVSADMLRRQVTLIGSWTFSTHIQAECARFCLERGIAVDELFTDYWTLDQADEAYRLFDQQNTGKGVFLL